MSLLTSEDEDILNVRTHLPERGECVVGLIVRFIVGRLTGALLYIILVFGKLVFNCISLVVFHGSQFGGK